MHRFILAGAAALTLTAPAAAFDNASCKEFLTGVWTLETDIPTEAKPTHVSSRSDYKADGTFTQTMTITIDGAAQPEIARKGTWDAGPGDTPDTCKASVTPEGSAAESVVLTVIDADNVKTPDGIVSTRVTE